jgi:hypothetical protein
MTDIGGSISKGGESGFFDALAQRIALWSAEGNAERAAELAAVARFLRHAVPKLPPPEAVKALLANIQKMQSLTKGVEESIEFLDFELLIRLRAHVEQARAAQSIQEAGTFEAIAAIVEAQIRRTAGLGQPDGGAALLCGLFLCPDIGVSIEEFPQEKKQAARELLAALSEAAVKSGLNEFQPTLMVLSDFLE